MVDSIAIAWSARKHGISDDDIRHALNHVFRYKEDDYDGESRVFAIGPDRAGRLLELVLQPAFPEPIQVIHADQLQSKNYRFL